MKIGKPIPRSEIPEAGRGDGRGSSKYEGLYQQVLSLNGEVLPVKFETVQAMLLAHRSFTAPRGRARKLGISTSTRGTTIYLFKGEADSA